MEQVRMKRSFTYDVPGRPGVTRTVPAGWTGALPDEVAAAAEDDGAAVILRAEGKSRPGKSVGRGRGSRRVRGTASPSATEPAEGAGDGESETLGGDNADDGGEGARELIDASQGPHA